MKEIKDYITKTVTEKKPDQTDHVTTVATSYSTTLCPITETITKDGKTETKTWTSTSVKEIKVPTTIKVEVTGKPTTIHKTDIAYETQTKLIPETITKTKDGKTETIVKVNGHSFPSRFLPYLLPIANLPL